MNSYSEKVMHRVLISRIIAPALLTSLCFVIAAVSTAQAQVLGFIVEMNQEEAGARFTVQADNATTLHWLGRMSSRLTEHSDILTVSGSGSWDDPPDDKPHKPCGVWPGLNTLIELVSWLPLYAQEMVVGYRLWLSLQEDSLPVKSVSWWPVVINVVLGKFVYTGWHSEAPSFNQWEQQQHRVSYLKIITCMDHPPGQSVYPQGGDGAGISNQWGGCSGWENGFHVYDGYDLSGGGGGGHYPYDEHTYDYRPCPACFHRQPCQYAVVDAPNVYAGQPGSLMSDALALSHNSPEPEVPMNNEVGDSSGYQGGNAMAEVIALETGRVLTQQESPVHKSDCCLCDGCFPPSRGDSGVSSGVESTAAALQAPVEPSAFVWPSEHNPNDMSCCCQVCLDLLVRCVMPSDDQGIDCVAEATFSDRDSGDSPGTGSVMASQQKTHRCPHKGCDKAYLSRGPLTKHIKKAHAAGDPEIHRCPYKGCGKTYPLPGQLTTHIKRVHATEEQKIYRCPYKGCGQAFALRGLLTKHTRRAHATEEQKTHRCLHEGCGKTYVYASQLTQHMKQAHNTGGLKPHRCKHEGCDAAYAYPSQLATHMNKAHATEEQKLHQCPHEGCSKIYVYVSQLAQHLKQAHTTEGQKIHRCKHEGCGMAYAYPSQLTQHLRQSHGTVTAPMINK